jgi:hypothetical protein
LKPSLLKKDVLLKSTQLFCRIINTYLRCVDTTHHWRVTQIVPQVFSKLFLPHDQFYSFSAARSILQFFCRKILPHQQFLTFACRRRSPVKVPNFPLWGTALESLEIVQPRFRKFNSKYIKSIKIVRLISRLRDTNFPHWALDW